MTKLQDKVRQEVIWGGLVFLILMTVYLFTLAPTIYIEDSGEFITAAATLGIAHPSGYPLYVLLGKLFTFIPLGSIAWRVNLMSAFFGALTCSLLYLIVRKLTNSHFIGVVSGLILGFSEIFWSQSIIAEVYTLNSFFVALTFLLLILWSKNPKDKYLYWFAFVYGLSLTNHEMMGLLGPFFLIYIFWVKKAIWRNWRLMIKMSLLFFLGLTVYLYLPLRSLQNPILDWGDPQTLESFWRHITRKFYGDFSVSSQLWNKIGLVFGFFLEVVEQFYLPTLLLASGGLFYIFKKNKKFAFLTLALFLANSLGVIFLRNAGWSFEADYVFRVYYLPCYIFLLVWFAIIWRYLYVFLKKTIRKENLWRLLAIFILTATLIIPASLLFGNYYLNDLSDFWLNFDYADELLKRLEPDSVLVMKGSGLVFDTEFFSLMYFQAAEKFRTDVIILEEIGLFPQAKVTFPKEYYQLEPKEQRRKFVELVWNFAKDRNLKAVYTNFPVDFKADKFLPALASRSNGLVYKIYPNIEEAKKDSLPLLGPNIRNFNDKKCQDIFGCAGFLANLNYTLASFYFENGLTGLASHYHQQAVKLDPNPLSARYYDFVNHRNRWQGKD